MRPPVHNKSFPAQQPSTLSAGTVFIKKGVRLPEGLLVQVEDYAGWEKVLDANSLGLERMAVREGWRFSFLMPPVNAGAWGFTAHSASQKAIEKITKSVGRSGFNSFEIVSVVGRGIWGLHHVQLVACPRQLQPTPFLRQPDPDRYPLEAPNFEEVYWKAAERQPEIKGI